jgi:Copper binding proteins, plastocyanin/azurin family
MTSDYAFSPNSLEIQAGDTVTWYNNDEFDTHNAQSDDLLWDTGDVGYQESVTLTFNTPGTYPYRDSLWYPIGMTGTIVVKAASLPAPALITEPMFLPDSSFRFTITNLTSGKTNVIEMSTNLLQWTALATNVPAGNTLEFTNAPATGKRFYRSLQIP